MVARRRFSAKSRGSFLNIATKKKPGFCEKPGFWAAVDNWGEKSEARSASGVLE